MLKIKKVYPQSSDVDSKQTMLHKEINFVLTDDSDFTITLYYSEEVLIMSQRQLKVGGGLEHYILLSIEKSHNFQL